MAERFEDMVLDLRRDGPIGCTPESDGYCTSHDRLIRVCAAEAQHEADMAYEVACPCGCHRPERSECDLCSGTGRVTLGALVEADKARKATA